MPPQVTQGPEPERPWRRPGPRQTGPQLKTTLDGLEFHVKLPNVEKARVSEAKLREYLLSTTHTIGRFKASFFARLGFTIENWEELRGRLLDLAEGDAEPAEPTEYGQKYIIPGTLEGPIGAGEVVTVWIVLAGDDAPRLVTVYPR